MIYRILQKLNNFSIKFTIFIISLAIIINVIFKMYVQDSNYYTEIRYFNIALFIILVITLFNFIFTWSSAYQMNNKLGPEGDIGIEGPQGLDGALAKCDLECGADVCYATIKKDIDVEFNTLLKDNSDYIKQLEEEDDYAGYIKYKNDINPFKIRYRNNYLNSELKQDKIEQIVVNNDYEFVIINKENDRILLKRGSYDKMALSKLDIEEDDIINRVIRFIEINTYIKNDFFLNKINILCHSNNYQELLRRTGKYETTEYKLITYMSNTIHKWILDLINFRIEVEGSILYPGIRFLKTDDFTIEMLNAYKKSDGMPINNPFNHFNRDIDGEVVITKGPIKKYDIWRWDEVYSNAPLVIRKCFKNDNLPQGNEPKLSIIKTNSYEPLYTSEINKDIYDTLICPFNQMGLDGTNPNNLEYCVYLETSSSPNYVKKTLPVWKRKECIKFQQDISIYQPRFSNGQYYYSDPVTKRKYFPIGSVWTGTSDINPPPTKAVFPSIGSSCSNNYNNGPQKETILVSGDIKQPVDYKLIWNSDVHKSKKSHSKSDKEKGVTIYSEADGNGENEILYSGTYYSPKIPGGKKFTPSSLSVDDHFNISMNVSINNKEIEYKFNSSKIHNIGFDDSKYIPESFQFGFEPVNPSPHEYGLEVQQLDFLKNSVKFITSYVIYSEQQTANGTYYNPLSFDEGIYFKKDIYDGFKENKGACAYFGHVDMYKQEILQGYSQTGGLSKNTQYYACVLFRDYKFEQDQGHGEMSNLSLISSKTRADTLWLQEGSFNSDYISKHGFSKIVSSLIVLPGFEATLSNKDGSEVHTFKAGYWPFVATYSFGNDVMDSIVVKRVKNTVTFGPNQCWTIIKVPDGKANEYFIQSPWLPVWFSLNPNGAIKRVDANKRFDKNFTINTNVCVKGDHHVDEKILLTRLPNNKYTIQSASFAGYYLWAENGNFGLYKLGNFWKNIKSMKISYIEPTMITIENIQNSTYCIDDGDDMFISCNTKKTNLNENNNFIMNYNQETNSISLKGQQSNKYATLVDNSLKFSSNNNVGETTRFYLSTYNSDAIKTRELVYKINNLNEPITVVLKCKVGHSYKSLGITGNGRIAFMDNFLFKIKEMGVDNRLQPGPYNSISIWRPIPPTGYISVGDLAINNNYIGGKLQKPPVYQMTKNMSLYQLNNNMGPPIVCVPSGCVKEIDNNQVAWNNTKGGYVNIYNNYNEYKSRSPSLRVKQDPCYLWVDGITDAIQENKNRQYQNFINDDGYNLFRCTTSNSPSSEANGRSYSLKEECLRVVVPNTGFNYPGELSLFGNRPNYMKDTGYLPKYEHAYVESNAPINEYNKIQKSYYIEYVKDAKPNEEQLKGVPKGTPVKGNKLYYINTENPAENNFTNCLAMECDKSDKCSIITKKCNYNDDKMLWRVKGTVGEDDILGFDPSSSKSENENINLMNYGNGDNKCIKQYYNPDGQNVLITEDCSWKKPTWKYKSLNISDL